MEVGGEHVPTHKPVEFVELQLKLFFAQCRSAGRSPVTPPCVVDSYPGCCISILLPAELAAESQCPQPASVPGGATQPVPGENPRRWSVNLRVVLANPARPLLCGEVSASASPTSFSPGPQFNSFFVVPCRHCAKPTTTMSNGVTKRARATLKAWRPSSRTCGAFGGRVPAAASGH